MPIFLLDVYIQHGLWSLALMHTFIPIDTRQWPLITKERVSARVKWPPPKCGLDNRGNGKKKCSHTRKPLRNYEMSPTTTWSTCSSTFVSLRFHHFSSCLLLCLLSAVLFISFFSSSMLFLENKFMRMKCVGFFSGLLTSFFSVQVSTLYGRFVLLHKRNLAENIVEKQGTALIEGLKKKKNDNNSDN